MNTARKAVEYILDKCIDRVMHAYPWITKRDAGEICTKILRGGRKWASSTA